MSVAFATLACVVAVLVAWCRELAKRINALEEERDTRIKAIARSPHGEGWSYETLTAVGGWARWVAGELGQLQKSVTSLEILPPGHPAREKLHEMKRDVGHAPKRVERTLEHAVYDAILVALMDKGSRGACTNDARHAADEVLKVLATRESECCRQHRLHTCDKTKRSPSA